MRTSAGGARLAALLLAWLAGVATQLHERSLLPLPMYVGAAGVAAILLGVAIRLRRGGRGITVLAAAEAAGFPVERLCQRVRDAIYASVADRRAAGVLAALAVGTRARSSATTGISFATLASPTRCRSAACT
jgi:hypothetical protein